ncbi:hypothetical protein HanRHA438_Chr12g0569991 [Helianthus annuus]|nr:hypothetical protein HanHA300_Chr12g0457871 [Helianthus annuus]KAJ0494922.1 hypothetical protein HanIR_Chr12g0603001 [Helianthus annuus]KAJ0506562.1 hypothetical protein HanHA89_Chr12g0483451 [Helianthus annuus]KAJ0676238.1 hypothetical protein HanLR1_Chr12g0460431 [Helianthus annuus]KAJ0868033.1 hypothetical protein HanRHA438_Chr12g0569991 [Helianthus annuus]
MLPYIWKSRNDWVFNGYKGSTGRIVDEVKEMSFLWIKERSKLKNLVWDRWKDFNIRDVIK